MRGAAEQQRGNLRQALENFRAGQQAVLAAEVKGGRGAPSNVWQHRRALAWLHVAEAEADLGLADDAAQAYAAAVAIFAHLVDAVPDNRNWQRDLAYARAQQGWLAFGMNNPALAYQCLLQAQTSVQALLAFNPKSIDWRTLIAQDRNYLSRVYLNGGKRPRPLP